MHCDRMHFNRNYVCECTKQIVKIIIKFYSHFSVLCGKCPTYHTAATAVTAQQLLYRSIGCYLYLKISLLWSGQLYTTLHNDNNNEKNFRINQMNQMWRNIAEFAHQTFVFSLNEQYIEMDSISFHLNDCLLN